MAADISWRRGGPSAVGSYARLGFRNLDVGPVALRSGRHTHLLCLCTLIAVRGSWLLDDDQDGRHTRCDTCRSLADDAMAAGPLRAATWLPSALTAAVSASWCSDGSGLRCVCPYRTRCLKRPRDLGGNVRSGLSSRAAHARSTIMVPSLNFLTASWSGQVRPMIAGPHGACWGNSDVTYHLVLRALSGQVPNSSQYLSTRASRSNFESCLPSSLVCLPHMPTTAS